LIRRLFADEAERVNDWVRRDGDDADLTEFLSNDLNVCLASGEGCAFFMWRGPGIYEVHVNLEQRGREVIRLSHQMLEVMRREHGAKLFWAAVPIESRHVIIFTRLMGWKSQGVADLPHATCELFIGE